MTTTNAPLARPALITRTTTAPSATTASVTTMATTPATTTATTASSTTTTAAARARVLGSVVPALAPAPAPRAANVEAAFDALPSSSVGDAKVRRFADDNVGAWNMVLDLARSAEKSMHFSFFTVEKDPYGWSFLGAALYNQLRGVQVTGMTDWSANARGRGFVSTAMGYEYLQELANNGAKMAVFNTPVERGAHAARHGLSYGVVGCNHDKILVVDGGTDRAQGETGGRNIAAPYHQDTADNAASWRDDTMHIKGKDATAGFVRAIEREYAGQAARVVQPDVVNLANRSREMLFAYAMMEEWVSRAPLSSTEKATLRTNETERAVVAGALLDASEKRLAGMIKALPAQAQAKIPTTMTALEYGRLMDLAHDLVGDAELCGSRAAYDKKDGFVDARVKVVDQTGAPSAAPGQRFNEIAPALKTLVDAAQKEILIQNPYVVLTEPMIKMFEEAAKRGVKITIVTNSPESTDSAITQGFFLNDWPMLMARIPTLQVHVATGSRKFHAKCFVVDDSVSGDMSYNADLLSGRVNGEVGALTKSKEAAQHLKDAIAADLANPANGFAQWTIQRDSKGKAVLDKNGAPIVTRGPADDVSPKLMRRYGPMQTLCRVLAANNDDLSHPSLNDALRARDAS